MRHLALALLTVAALCAATGCPNVMNGTVDDQKIGPARSALFDTIDTGLPDAGADGDLLWVIISGLEAASACDAVKESFDVDTEVSCEDYCEEQVAIAEQYFRQQQYWSLDLTLLPAGDAVDTYVEGDVWDFVTGDPVFSGGLALTISADARDLDTCVEQCEEMDAEPENWWEADGGTVEITDYAEEDVLAGSYDVDFEGDPVSGEFQAQHCDFND